MKVSHFGGTVFCATIEDQATILNIRFGTGVNEYWISGEDDNPCLAILVKDDYANLTFFPEDGHPGFQSVGMGTDLNMEEITVFNTNTPNEEMEVNNDSIVPFTMALEAAKEFFASLTMPTCLEWIEL
jgi:hypothetical protein